MLNLSCFCLAVNCQTLLDDTSVIKHGNRPISIRYTPCPGKKEATVFVDKFRHSFVLFGTNHPHTAYTKPLENLAQHCNTVTWR